MTMSLENRILKGLDFDDATYYSLSHVYTSLVVQVHSVVVTQKGFKYLRVWRARRFGPAKLSEEKEECTFRVTQEIFKSYLVPPDPQIGKAIEYFGKPYLLEIAVYDNHQEVLKTIKSGDFILLENLHIGSKNKVITLIIHGGGYAAYNREIAPIPTDFVDPKMRLFRKRCRRMLEQVTNYENYEEFVEQEELEENDNSFAEPYKNIMIGDEIAVNYFPKSSPCSYHFLTNIHPEYIRDLDLTADRIVYCSEKTADILPEIMGIDSKDIPAGSISTMQINYPCSFEGFQATMIDSNHCPGSAMILFEGEIIWKHAGGPILCTGDFRADKTFLSELKSGPCRFLMELKLAKIYMDNTYFSLDQNILQLDHARESLVKTIESQHPDKNIIIPLHRLGRESLIESLVQALNEPILVFKERLEIARILNIHAKHLQKNKTRNIEIVEKDKWEWDSTPENSVVINISMKDCIVESQQDKVINIRYSNHSSRYEILNFLNALHFDSIYPCAKTFSKNEMRLMLEAGKKQYEEEDLDRQLDIHQFVTTDIQETLESLEVVSAQVLAAKPPNLVAETSDTGFCEESGTVQTVSNNLTIPEQPENPSTDDIIIIDEPPRKKGKFQNLLGKIVNI